MGYRLISAGSVSASIVEPMEIFGPALMLQSPAFIFVHNHPSGNVPGIPSYQTVAPSPDDLGLLDRIAYVGRQAGIRMVDFMVVSGAGNGSYWSAAEKGRDLTGRKE
jgi:DNA repair protein RadC